MEIDQIVLYDVSHLLNKKCRLTFTVMTFNGIESFHTPIYTITDNQIESKYSQFINIEKVDFEILEFYMNKKMTIQFLTEGQEKVEKMGKLPPPIIVKEKKLFSHDYKDRKSARKSLIEK